MMKFFFKKDERLTRLLTSSRQATLALIHYASKRSRERTAPLFVQSSIGVKGTTSDEACGVTEQNLCNMFKNTGLRSVVEQELRLLVFPYKMFHPSTFTAEQEQEYVKTEAQSQDQQSNFIFIANMNNKQLISIFFFFIKWVKLKNAFS